MKLTLILTLNDPQYAEPDPNQLSRHLIWP